MWRCGCYFLTRYTRKFIIRFHRRWTESVIDTQSICGRGSGFARWHAALENARTWAVNKMRERKCADDGVETIDNEMYNDNDDLPTTTTTTRTACYQHDGTRRTAFVDCSALLSRWRAARPAMRRALHLRNDRAGSPTARCCCCLLPSSSRRRGEKGEKKGTRGAVRRAKSTFSDIPLFWPRETEFALPANRALKGRPGRVRPDALYFQRTERITPNTN